MKNKVPNYNEFLNEIFVGAIKNIAKSPVTKWRNPMVRQQNRIEMYKKQIFKKNSELHQFRRMEKEVKDLPKGEKNAKRLEIIKRNIAKKKEEIAKEKAKKQSGITKLKVKKEQFDKAVEREKTILHKRHEREVARKTRRKERKEH
jgi:hypothetical protein